MTAASATPSATKPSSSTCTWSFTDGPSRWLLRGCLLVESSWLPVSAVVLHRKALIKQRQYCPRVWPSCWMAHDWSCVILFTGRRFGVVVCLLHRRSHFHGQVQHPLCLSRLWSNLWQEFNSSVPIYITIITTVGNLGVFSEGKSGPSPNLSETIPCVNDQFYTTVGKSEVQSINHINHFL